MKQRPQTLRAALRRIAALEAELATLYRCYASVFARLEDAHSFFDGEKGEDPRGNGR